MYKDINFFFRIIYTERETHNIFCRIKVGVSKDIGTHGACSKCNNIFFQKVVTVLVEVNRLKRIWNQSHEGTIRKGYNRKIFYNSFFSKFRNKIL